MAQVEFKVGQVVAVLKAYANGTDGFGRFVGTPMNPESRGKYLVAIDGMHIAFELERILSEEQYATLRKRASDLPDQPKSK